MHTRVLASRYNRSGHAEFPAVFRMQSRSWLLNTCRCGPIKRDLQRTCVTVATTPRPAGNCPAMLTLDWHGSRMYPAPQQSFGDEQ